MSKKSRKRNQALAAIVGLMGAKSLGLLGGKTTGINVDKGRGSELASKFRSTKKPIVGKTEEFRKSFATGNTGKSKFPKLSVDEIGNVTKSGVDKGIGNKKSLFINRKTDSKFPVGIYKDGKKISDLNQKSINVLSDGSIQTGDKTFSGKKEYRKFKDAERLKKRTTSMSKSTNKKNPGLFGFKFDKPLFKKGSMIKARGGGMARTKSTKLY